MDISVLSNRVAWFGKHSGYDCIDQYFPKKVTYKTFFSNQNSLYNKIIGKSYQYRYGVKGVSPYSLAAGIQFLNTANKFQVNHMLYLEPHIHLLKIAKKDILNRLTATIHLPYGQWKEDRLNKLPALKNPIILYENDIEKFEKHLPDAKMKFIRHGIDNSFFKPGSNTRDKTRILCVGHYLRNFDMLERVIKALIVKSKALSFHLVIPAYFRNEEAIIKLSKYEQVFFYEKLSDEELLKMYQDYGMLLIPMNDSGANTAIVQGIACGIPVITTDTGGIRSYGGGDIYPIIDNDDDQRMTDLVVKYIDDNSFFDATSNGIRKFSVEKMDWHDIALQHVEYYTEIITTHA